MFEAFGSGKPFVGTKVGGVPEIITSEDYGFLVEPANSEDLAEKILIALDKGWALWPLEKGLRSFIEMKQFVSEEQIHATKIPEDLWPGEGWGKLGHVIEVVMGCFVSGDVK
jgi:glycosyltransferase involved in cell wall biosynthesis